MPIITGNTILASDFVSSSSGASDSGKVAKLNANGKIEEGFLNLFFPQQIPIYSGSSSVRKSFVTSDTTGSTLFVAYDSAGTTATIIRFQKDTKSGIYYKTHSTTLSIDSSTLKGIVVVGSYVYVSAIIGAVQSLRRYAVADLSGVTTMTGMTDAAVMWSEGTNLYVFNSSSAWKKYTISGTALTDTGPTTFTSSGTTIYGCISNGTYAYITDSDGTGTFNIRKYALTGGAALSTTTINLKVDVDYNGQSPILFIQSVSLLGIGWQYDTISPTAIIGTKESLTAITMP